MKKKIVIKVTLPNDKSRAKAMALVSGVTGVISMAITGDLKDRLEVVGEGVDAVGLVRCLRTTKFDLCLCRKKFDHVEILTVEEVKDKKNEEKKPEKKEEKKETKPPQCSCPSYPCYPHPGPLPMAFVCEEPSNSSCSIM